MPDKIHHAQPLAAARSPWLRGRVPVPGDRSASRLALVLAALSRGESSIEHAASGPEIKALVKALARLGVAVEHRGESWAVHGLGPAGFLPPDGLIELEEMDESSLLLIALLGAHAFQSELSGYEPTAMGEALLDYLGRTGTRVTREAGTLTLRGPRLPLPLDLRLPEEAVALKAPLMLMALVTAGSSYLRLPTLSDPADDVFTAFGATVSTVAEEDGTRLVIEGLSPLKATPFRVSSDPVYAAFPAVAALIAPDSEIEVEALATSPRAIGVLDALKLMGADISMQPSKQGGHDAVDLVARHSRLKGVNIPADLAIETEDFAILAVAAAFAQGQTLFEGLTEGMRRLNLTRALRANGIDCEEREAGLAVSGMARVPGGGNVATRLDPKLAMAFLVLGMGADKPVTVDDGGVMADVFPDFVPAFEHVGCRFIAGKAN